jgi:ribosomal protein S9
MEEEWSMSFSFYATAKTKDEARALVIERMTEVVRSQPAHEKDQHVIVATVSAYLELIKQEAGQQINVAVSGSVGWRGQADVIESVSSAAINVSVRTEQVS